MADAAVLIVDDEKQARETCRMILKDNYDCVLAESGEECIKTMDSLSPDLIILDNKMPNGWDGLETLQRIREINPTVPVVILTGYGSLENAKQAIKYEVFEYLSKPFDNDDLIDVVQRGVSRKQQKEEEEAAVSETMNKMRANLKEASRLSNIGKVSPTVIHQMKNPLALIMGYSEMLLLELKNSKKGAIDYEGLTSRLTLIESQADRCTKMARSLLHISSPDEDMITNKHLSTILEEIHSLVLPSCMINNINFEVDDSENNTLLCLHNNDLHEVLLNLLFNAIEAIKEKGSIRISTFCMETSSNEWQQRLTQDEIEHVLKSENREWTGIEVSNNGEPIPPEDFDQIFKKCFTSKGSEGSGLGLSICTEKTQRNGGIINLIKSDETATVFRILMPAQVHVTN